MADARELLGGSSKSKPEDDERSLAGDLLAGAAGAVSRLQRKLKGKKKPEDGPVASIGIRG